MPDYFRTVVAHLSRHAPQTGTGASSPLAHQLGFYFTVKEIWIGLAVILALLAVAAIRGLARRTLAD